MTNSRIVVIGGGTGSFMLLSALKKHTKNITALVNMADDGGSTGQLRDELGVLPPGDVRQCLVALSQSEKVRDLFNYRFSEGSLEGHAFGNLFLTALEKLTGSFAEAVETSSEVLKIVGAVHPITLDQVTLVMKDSSGKVTKGEFEIGHADFGAALRPEMSLEPVATINPAAERAILEADLVVIAPGNLYGSLAPALIVDGVSNALCKSKAKKLYVCNLMTKPGQTDKFNVVDFVSEIQRFMKCGLDYVIYNNQKPNEALLGKYAKEGEYWIEPGSGLRRLNLEAVGADLIAGEIRQIDSKADKIAETRTLIRHDGDKVAKMIMELAK